MSDTTRALPERRDVAETSRDVRPSAPSEQNAGASEPAVQPRREVAATRGAAGPKPGPRSAAEIEADLAATRERLAETVDALTARVQPKVLAARGADRAKLTVMAPDGTLRTERLIRLGVAVAGVVGALTLLRYLVRRSR
ncbi:DUF3618 domain-containing protein [Actinopolymorpha pittospori]|uniref:DUF3618 domain-containing protein n=1 Tax=Actinopolymorpha pittospori TaxID=648752 RepID=A0A927RK84_9ACTN|nr:hypothetical protein [Actinopolymorpha pittospori]